MKALMVLLIVVALASPVWGQTWPDQAVSLVTDCSPELPWPGASDPQYAILKSLEPRLSRQLGVPVTVFSRPESHGVLAADLVVEASASGYLLGALGPDATMNIEIQLYSPYLWAELLPVATAWRRIYALIVRADFPATDIKSLAGLARKNPVRLAHLSLSPASVGSVLALETARAASFEWKLQAVERMDPVFLLQNQAEAMVLPLAALRAHPQASEFKVLAVYAQNEALPCLEGLSTARSQGLDIGPTPLLAFYVPRHTSKHIVELLSQSLNRALNQAAVAEAIEKACLELSLSRDAASAKEILDSQYQRQSGIQNSLGLVEP